MQTSEDRACSESSERSLSYAKIMQIADIMPARGKNMHRGGKKKRRGWVAAQPDGGGAAGAFSLENAPLQRKTGRFIGRRRPFGEPVRHVFASRGATMAARMVHGGAWGCARGFRESGCEKNCAAGVAKRARRASKG